MIWKPIKLIRDRIAEREPSNPEVKLEPVAPEDRGRLLRAKLAEEVQEYMEDRSVEELADIIEACFVLAKREHGVPVPMLLELARAKRAEKGGFNDAIGLFVKVEAKRS